MKKEKSFSFEELARGTRHEEEHTATYDLLEEFVANHGKLPMRKIFYQAIAFDHLEEDPEYYIKLESIEKE